MKRKRCVKSPDVYSALVKAVERLQRVSGGLMNLAIALLKLAEDKQTTISEAKL